MIFGIPLLSGLGARMGDPCACGLLAPRCGYGRETLESLVEGACPVPPFQTSRHPTASFCGVHGSWLKPRLRA